MAGDVYFYSEDHDLSTEAENIDTDSCPVYLLIGEYDGLTVPITLEAADRITGARCQIMTGLGHFPMSEDHDNLMKYVLPVLDETVKE
jgi:pimeloyl-ACP methyl ester carboxylesterase